MAIHFSKVDSRIKARIVKKLAQDSSVFLLLMDCHAANAARNDGKPQNLNDSAQDSRILEIESWLFEPRKEIRLEVYRHSACLLYTSPSPRDQR